MVDEFQTAFISYGRLDSKAFATRLHRRLLEAGCKVWFDQNDIPLAVDFQEQIDDGIEKSDNFLFIIAPHSVNSPYCRKEIELALRYRKRIIPLLHVEQIDHDTWQQRNPAGTDAEWTAYTAKGLHSSFPNMHPEIGKINWVYFREGLDDFEQSLAGLLDIFDRDRDYVRQHTALLVKALDWERQQKQSRYLLIGEERQQATVWLKQQFKQEQPPCLPADLHCEFITESIKNANSWMTQIFLAHAEEETAVSEQVRLSLMRQGFTVWTSRTDIQMGVEFQTAIDRGIEEVDNVVLLLSMHALRSPYCQHEINYALALNKRIIPLLVSPVEPTQVPIKLRSLQYLDLSSYLVEADYQRGESQLLRVLRQEATYYEEHKILLTKALKWERQQRNPSILLRGYNLRHAETWLKVAQQHSQHPPIPLQQEFIAESLRQPPSLSLDVFVSYSRTDSDFARRLNDALQFQGKTTWFDQESIASGTDFQQEIYRGIESANYFLFILSPSSVQSSYCADEVEYAQKLNKRIVTVLHRSINSAELHPGLAAVQWIDFNQREGDFSANFSELLRTLDTDREHLQAHTRLLVRALEWDGAGRKESLLLRGDALEQAEQWLAQSQEKQPRPTELHITYLHTSRMVEDASYKATQILQQAAIKGKRRVLIGTTVMTIGLAIAGLAGFLAYRAREQAVAATQQAQEAQQGTQLEREGNTALKQFQVQQLDGLISAMETAQGLRAIVQTRPLNAYPAFSPLFTLQTILNTIRERDRIMTQQGQILGVGFVAPGQLLTIDAEGTLHLWQGAGEQPAELKLGKALWSARVSRDGQQIAAIAKDGLLYRWTRQGQGVTNLQAYPPFRVSDGKSYVSLGFSPESQRLVTLQEDGTVRLWNLKGQALDTLKLGGANLSLSPDGQQVATVGREDGIVRLHSLTGKTGDRSFKTGQQTVLSIRFSPDGQQLATGDRAGVVRFWSQAGQQIDQIKTQQDFLLSLDFSPDGQQLATADAAGTIHLWNRTQRSLAGFPTQQGSVLSISFSPDGQQLLTAAGTDLIKTWNPEGKTMGELSPQGQSVTSVAISPDGTTLATGTADGKLQLHDRTGQPLTPTWQAHSSNLYSVQFSPDGQHLLTASEEGTAKLWTRTGQLQAELRLTPGSENPPAVSNASFSADGQQILTASQDGLVRWWSLTGQLQASFNPHQGQAILSLSVSPDGQRFATASSDGTVRLWSTNRNLLAEFQFSHPILSLSFSPRGDRLAAGSEDGSLRWIPVDSLADLLARGCDWLTAYLSHTQRQNGRSICPAS